MKFQNPSFKVFFERRDGQTNGQKDGTDGQAESNMLPTISKMGA